MPVFKRGRGLGGWLPQAKKKKNDDGTSSRSGDPVKPPPDKLAIMSKIGYEWDKWHSLYKHLPEDILDLKEILRKEIGSFLNGAGGILCFGCRENGTIYGIDISRKEEDNLRQIIDNTLTRFHPFVHPNNYRVRFKEVSGVRGRSERKMVIEVKVTANSRYIMYEDESHEVYVRDKNKYKGPLTPHEIKDLVTDLYYKRLAANTNKSSATSKSSDVASTSSKSSHPLEVCNKASKQDNYEIEYITISDDEDDEACDTVTAKQDSKPPATSDTVTTKVDSKSSAGDNSTKVHPKPPAHDPKPLPPSVHDMVTTNVDCTVTAKVHPKPPARDPKPLPPSVHDMVTTKVDSKPTSQPQSSSTSTGSYNASKANGGTFKRLVRKFNPFGPKSHSSKEPDSKAEVSNRKIVRPLSGSKSGESNKENIHTTQPMKQTSIPTTTVSHSMPSYCVPPVPRPPLPSYSTSSMKQTSIPTTTVSHSMPSYCVPPVPRPPLPSYSTSSMKQTSIPTTTIPHSMPSYCVPPVPRPPLPSYSTSSKTHPPYSVPPSVPHPPHCITSSVPVPLMPYPQQYSMSSMVYGVSATSTVTTQPTPISYPNGSHAYTSHDYGHGHYYQTSEGTGSQPQSAAIHTNAGQQYYHVYK